MAMAFSSWWRLWLLRQVPADSTPPRGRNAFKKKVYRPVFCYDGIRFDQQGACGGPRFPRRQYPESGACFCGHHAMEVLRQDRVATFPAFRPDSGWLLDRSADLG